MAVAALAALALSLIFGVLCLLRVAAIGRQRELQRAAQQAAQAGARAAQALLGYDYRTIATQVQRTAPLLTTKYAATYGETITGLIQALARQRHAVLQVTVKAVGTANVTPTTATVVVFADLASTNNQRRDVREDQTRAQLTLVRVRGAWLVDNVATQ